MTITLPPVDYFKFRALVGDVRAAQLDALAAQERVREAETKAKACFAALGQAHAFNPDLVWSWNDETCAITTPENPT